VINSGLDFSIHQTPYSIHFSLRKKFFKNPSNKTTMNSPSTNTSSPSQETIVDRFRQELLYTRNEYANLYNLYAAELEAKCKATMEDSRTNDALEDNLDVNHNLMSDGKLEQNEDLADSIDEETEPKLMSEGEKEAFLKETFAKVDKALENMWQG
jgi:hypothetical protein